VIISLTGVSREDVIKYQFYHTHTHTHTHTRKRIPTDKYFNESVLRLRDDALLRRRGVVYCLTE